MLGFTLWLIIWFQIIDWIKWKWVEFVIIINKHLLYFYDISICSINISWDMHQLPKDICNFWVTSHASWLSKSKNWIKSLVIYNVMWMNWLNLWIITTFKDKFKLQLQTFPIDKQFMLLHHCCFLFWNNNQTREAYPKVPEVISLNKLISILWCSGGFSNHILILFLFQFIVKCKQKNA